MKRAEEYRKTHHNKISPPQTMSKDKFKSKNSEYFANLNSVKNVIDGQAGSITDIVDNNTKVLVTYQPVKVFHNTWVVLLVQPIPQPQQQQLSSQNQTG